MGKTDFETAMTGILPELIQAGAVVGVVALAALMDGGLMTVPAVILTKWTFKWLKERKEVAEILSLYQVQLENFFEESNRVFA